jgi:hypothetical protein
MAANPIRLSSTLLQSSRLSPLAMDLTGLPFPPHIVIIDNIYFLPMAWRKLILDSCRIQAPISTNNHLLSEYEKLEPYTSIYVEGGPGQESYTVVQICPFYQDLMKPYRMVMMDADVAENIESVSTFFDPEFDDE